MKRIKAKDRIETLKMLIDIKALDLLEKREIIDILKLIIYNGSTSEATLSLFNEVVDKVKK